MTKRKREKRGRLSAKATAEKAVGGGFEMTSLRLPEGVNFFSVKKAGVKRVEIVPYTVGPGNPDAAEGELYFQRTYYTHRNIGLNGDVYVCPAKTTGQPCPVCEERARLDSSVDADPDLVKDLLPKKRQLWNVYDHSDPERGVQVWDISYHLFGKQLLARIRDADDEDEYEYFADPEDGLTLKIGFAEKSWAGNSFCEAETIDFKARREPLDPDILDAANDLDACVVVVDYDTLHGHLHHTAPAPAAADPAPADPEPAPKPKRKRAKAKAKAEPEPTPEPTPEPVAAAVAPAGDDDWDDDWD
jgi:hypothetical protein